MTDEAADIRLVVNADGFASSPAVSRGVLSAHRDGIVTSTSVMGTCAEPREVRALLACAPGLGVGVHLTLSAGAPAARPDLIRSLLGPDGRFPADARRVFLAWAEGTLRADEIEREFDAQVARLRQAGLFIDHLSTHNHIGFLPVVGRSVEAVAHKHGIAGIRMAVERPTLAWLVDLPRGLVAAGIGGLAWFTRRRLGALRHGPTTWGYIEAGRLDEIRILEIIGRLGPGPHELMCHPVAPEEAGDRASAARELEALTSRRLRQALLRRRIRLCRWADLF